MNHKRIKQLIAQKQKTVTDRQFFASRALAAYFEDIAAAQTKRYGVKRRVKVRIVWTPKNNDAAHTDNDLIWINAGHSAVTRFKTRQERYEQVCGLFAHELGHVLYTDFLSMQTFYKFLTAGKWYPEAPPLKTITEREAEREFFDLLRTDPKAAKILVQVLHSVLNALEDGYIEQRMLTDYPGVLGANLQIARDTDFEAENTLSQLMEQEEEGSHIWLSILHCILQYMVWGSLKYGEEPLSNERVQTVFALLSDLDNALMSRDFRDRCRTANVIIIRCWDYIKSFVDYCKDKIDESADAGSVAGQILLSSSGSTEAVGGTIPVTGGAEASAKPSPTAKARRETAKLAQKAEESASDEDETEKTASETSSEDDTGEESKNSATSSIESEDEKAENDGSDTIGSSHSGAEVAEDANALPGGNSGTVPDEAQFVSENEDGRIPLTDTDTVFAPEGGSTEHDDEYTGTGYPNAAADIQRILEKVAEETICSELERQRTKELTELAQSIAYGDIHKGVNKVVHRLTEVDDSLKDQYRDISTELLHISKQLQKSVLQQMRDSRRGGKQTGLLMGRRLDTHALSRNDGRVFCKNSLPNETPALAVGLLLDESGSMCSHDRATYARATAIILYDFCSALGIPVMVYGHSTSRNAVDLYSYAEFDTIDQNDRYRLMDISARGSNRDGAALRFVAEQLSKRTEDVKLLILVSDGQPADTGYMGTAAEADLRGVKQEYQRKGILFVAAAIGSDKENIERIYGDSFLDISDLTKLPIKLTDVIKRFLRV